MAELGLASQAQLTAPPSRHLPVVPVGRIAAHARASWGAYLQGVAVGAAARDTIGGECAEELFQESVRNGLFGYSLPVELGGSGGDALHWGLVLEQVGYLCGDGSFAALLSLRVSMVDALLTTAREDLIARWVHPMARGELFGAFAYTDGADPFAFATTVERVGSTLVLNGRKDIVTGGLGAGLFLTFARDPGDGDLKAVLLCRDDPGLEVQPLDTVGLRASGLASLELSCVTVPEDRLLLDVDGVSRAQRLLNSRRVMLVAPQVGAMQAVHEHCIRELSGTTRYGAPLTDMQNVQAALGRQYVAIQTARAVLHHALARAAGYTENRDGLFDPVISAAKHAVTDLGIDVATSAMRLLGTQGFVSGVVERYWRDATALLAGGGTQDVLEVDLGLLAVAEHELGPR